MTYAARKSRSWNLNSVSACFETLGQAGSEEKSHCGLCRICGADLQAGGWALSGLLLFFVGVTQERVGVRKRERR